MGMKISSAMQMKSFTRKWKYWLLVILFAVVLVYDFSSSQLIRLAALKLTHTPNDTDCNGTQYFQHAPVKLNHTLSDVQQFAVFGCSTPSSQGHRGYDYAFYLPLTALAWRRIGFQCIILIAGTEDEWQKDPALAVVLTYLEAIQVRVVFLDCPVANRPMLSQVARIFAANMKELQLKADNYLITTDADLWPLLKSHYEPKPGHSLVLVHSECCSKFTLAEKSYRMLPMSNIGASVQTWKDIMNYNRSVAHDAGSIMEYMEQYFDVDRIRNPVQYASSEWYFDQKLISVTIANWRERNPREPVFKVTDKGFKRLDRRNFRPELLTSEQFSRLYDSHLPLNPTEPGTWCSIRKVVQLMYGSQSEETQWCENYAHNYVKAKSVVLNESVSV